jgi:hypothetical protein
MKKVILLLDDNTVGIIFKNETFDEKTLIGTKQKVCLYSENENETEIMVEGIVKEIL